jgi:multicomponent Na+:H+ antiporter subunit C
MEPMLAIVVGVLFGGGVYLLLEGTALRAVFGLMLIGNAVNLLVITAGRVRSTNIPIVPEGLRVAPHDVANPLAQALVLTAIVIGLGLTVFAVALVLRATQSGERSGITEETDE